MNFSGVNVHLLSGWLTSRPDPPFPRGNEMIRAVESTRNDKGKSLSLLDLGETVR